MKRFLVFLLSLSLACSCQDRTHSNCDQSERIKQYNDSLRAIRNPFFEIDHLLQRSLEPALNALPHKSFRLFIKDSFIRDTWVYRIEKTETGARLSIKKTYQDVEDPREAEKDTCVFLQLNQTQWDDLEEVFEQNCFWSIPILINRKGLDGANYLLECYDPNQSNPALRHHMAVRWSPMQEDPFRVICDYIENLEGK